MSDTDSDDNVIRYGTPLDPYEEDEGLPKRKYQQQADQYAVDAHGRRRFHGAFTGGFSAGYGNTVGSAEGWTPSTFKSSRSDKAQKTSQRPEDFMDDEDRSEFGIAPRQIETHNEFSGLKRPRQQRYFDGPIPGEPVLEGLLRVVHETAAVRMLRAMGWREGQGIGQRVTRAEKRKALDQHKVYGCYIPDELRQVQQQSDTDDSDSEFDYDTLLAPEDYEPYMVQCKTDRFGLGYSGLSRHSVLGGMVGEYGSSSSSSHLVMKEKGKKVSIRGHAFGVGALEDEDADVYATEDMTHYDFAIGDVADEKQTKKVHKEKGVNVLPGFVKASQPLPRVASYPPPALPRDYRPAPVGTKRSRFEPITCKERDQGLGRHELTAEVRGALLGETPVPPPAMPAVTQPETRASTDSAAKLLGRNVSFVSVGDSQAEKQEENEELDYISIKDSGKRLTKVFKPFASDPKKQTRYERYLKDNTSAFEESNSTTDRLTEWERSRELAEFEQAAKLYKPLTGIMGDRFTHASEPDDGALNPLCAVAKSSINYGLATPEQVEAAKKGLYGVMTRRQVSWRPGALVCKRFNVPDPMGTRPEQSKEDKPKVSYSIFSYLESSVHDKDSFTKEQVKFSGSKSLDIINTTSKVEKVSPEINRNDQKIHENVQMTKKNEVTKNDGEKPSSGFNKRLTVAELFLRESEKDQNKKEEGVEVTDTICKFDKMDLYKSIFLSDSENEDELKDNVEVNEEKGIQDFVDTPKNVERNLSPPRGIFANVDFDEINSWRQNVDKRKTTQNTALQEDSLKPNEEKEQVDAEANLYGPKIPANLMKRLQEPSMESDKTNATPKNKCDTETEFVESSSSSDSWVEAKTTKDKKHKKKKSKKSKSHKQKKSKHKKNKR